MAKIVSNQLTFLDMTDQKKLSVYLSSNLQTIQVYNGTYNPSWEDTPLTIELQAFLDQTEITDGDTNLSIQWYVKDGTNEEVIIDKATNKILTIKKNELGTSESKMLTYICKATYLDYSASSQLTYSLIDAGDSSEYIVVFRVYEPNGAVVSATEESTEIKTILYKGAKEITSDITYRWYKYTSDGYKLIDGATNSTYVVQRNDVINVQTYQCVASYNGQTYVDVITIEDRNDTYVSEMLTIGGTIFKNGQGGSAVYVIVRSNGKEADPFPDGCVIGTEQSRPTNPTEGMYWWKVDYGAATFMKYNGTEWVETFDDTQSLDYIWTLMDKDGNVTEFYKTGKVIYLSCSEIDNIGTLQCDVKYKGAISHKDGMVSVNHTSGLSAADDNNGNVEVISDRTYMITDDNNGNVEIN